MLSFKFLRNLVALLLLKNFILTNSYTFSSGLIRDLIENDFADFKTETESWTASNNKTPTIISQCGTLFFLGGYNIAYPGSSFSRIYTGLPTHNSIFFTLYFAIVDLWQLTDTAAILFDSYPVTFLYNYNRVTYNTADVCGTTAKDRSGTRIRGKVFHTGTTLNITLVSNNAAETAAIGFRNLTLQFRNALPEETMPACVISLFGARRTNFCGNCPEGKYRGTDGTCNNCNPACVTCFGGSATDCGLYQPGIIPDGIRCAPYYSPCSNCGSNEVEFFSYKEYAWLGACSPPLMAEIQGTIKSCTQSCLSNQCLNPNGTCGETCDYPLYGVVRYNMTFCEYRCNVNQIMHVNTSCLTICGYPLQSRQLPLGKICEYPCASTEILSYYNTCESACSYPFKRYVNVFDRYCAYACNDTIGEILFYNNTCYPEVKCIAPLIKKNTAPPYRTCESPCPAGQYIYWNTSCKAACPAPFYKRPYPDLLFCDAPMCEGKPCKTCKSTGECPEDYYCNSFIGGFCVQMMAYFKVEVSRTITNGYVLMAEVTPKTDIQEDIDDILNMSIDDVILREDYLATIEKIGKAKFKITILIIKSISLNVLQARFQYSPNRLDYRTQVDLPRIIYISEATLKNSQKVGSALDTSFILLVVSIVAFLVLGKISNVFSFVCINQYLHGLRYLNVRYLDHTKFYFKSLKNYNALLTTNQEPHTDLNLAAKLKLILPTRFYEEDFSTSFLWNSIQIIGTISLTLTLLMLVFLILTHLKSPPQILRRLKSSLKWNILIRQVLTYALPLVTASFIQIYISIFSRDQNAIPLIAALVCLFTFIGLFGKMFFLINQIPENIQIRVWYTARYGALWQGLNLKGPGKYYYWISALRGILLMYVCVFVDFSPLIQIIVLILYQCGVISLFVKKFRLVPVLTDRGLNITSFGLEIFLLSLKGIILGNWVLSSSMVSDNVLVLAGWLIVGCGTLIQMMQAVYSIYMQISNWKKIWREIKGLGRTLCNKPRRKRVRRIKLERTPEIGMAK